MTADEHPTKISAPQIAAAKRTVINNAPGLAPQMGEADRQDRVRFGGGNGAIFRIRKFQKMPGRQGFSPLAVEYFLSSRVIFKCSSL
ncbi:MAG TPA: hypothetical protein VI137_12160 [Pseudolabrys sp.]|jgi:hypothetical protein